MACALGVATIRKQDRNRLLNHGCRRISGSDSLPLTVENDCAMQTLARSPCIASFFHARGSKASKVWWIHQPTGRERYENLGLPSQAKKKIARRNWSVSALALVKGQERVRRQLLCFTINYTSYVSMFFELGTFRLNRLAQFQ